MKFGLLNIALPETNSLAPPEMYGLELEDEMLFFFQMAYFQGHFLC